MPNPLHDPRYTALRNLLVATREDMRLTQVALAERLGKPQSYVSKYERGERRLDIVELVSVAHALEADPVLMLQQLLAEFSAVPPASTLWVKDLMRG